MSAALQKTKLFLPTPRPQLVARPRLLQRLDAIRGAVCRAAIISAPAGSGKTTVVMQWLARAGLPAAWVSLDARDNQPARFCAYLIAALQTVVPGAGKQALDLLQLPGVDLEEVVTILANDLAQAPGLFVLALDDFHTLANPALSQAMDRLLDAQPPQMRLLLLSREDPALQLARRRALGQLVELRQEDLRFTLPEALAFLNQGMGLQLSGEQVEALETRTEGWIAGLQMAALSLQRAPDANRFIRAFSGSNRFILDYLMEEVLAQQPPEIQDFLLETAFLERMCAGLCAALRGVTSLNAQKMLDHLAKANLFVIPLDEERRWFRYHHLFSDLLLARLQEEKPQRMLELFGRASAWYEANDDPRLAVEYALKAQQPRRAADLIERHITERWQTVDLDFFMSVNHLPAEVIAERPTLCLQSAWICVITGQADRIPFFVQAAEQRLNAPGRQPAPADAANRAFAQSLRAYLADLHNQPVRLDESLGMAFAAIPEANTGMRNSVAVMLGTIYFMEGDFASAMRYYQDALERDKRVNGTNAVPIATLRMAWLLQAQGRLRAAAQLLRENEAYVRARGNRRFYISGVLNLLWGGILLEWNQLEQAGAQIDEGLRLLEDWPFPQVLTLGESLLARLYTARGELAPARAALQRAEALARSARFHPEFSHALERARVGLWIADQNRAALADWIQENAPLAAQGLPFRHEARLIELCRAWLALGRQEEAAALLEALLARLSGEAAQRRGSRIALLALLAAARAAEPLRARAALEEALRLGEPEGYLRTFVNAGQGLRPALKSWLEHPPPQDGPPLHAYARRILAALDAPAPTPPGPQPAELTERLSPRELEVLRLVAKGLTNQQIADRLVISVRTVKKHVENIDGKLGAQNRTQAVERARELGLLNTG